ncbi:Kinesin-like protein KIF6 [Camelus dromedarius]|uniref:Kinesin-like protein KIF6 n=1 Tax=Camelus dromedarius TaxID=9838 RepID=A0A5N4CRU1_CAMDR|nr:Kinesin-like protein KIF6 [Camelus dromedarius]
MEEKLRSQLEEEKTRYKTMFTRLKALKVEIEHLQLLMDKAKVKLQKEFDAWWAEEATSLQVNSPPVNLFNHVKPFPQTPESQHKRSQLLSNQSDVYTRKILPSPGPLLHSQVQSSTGTRLEDSIAKRPVSSVPLTGDSQTDSDILAFIKARQSILQRTGAPVDRSALLSAFLPFHLRTSTTTCGRCPDPPRILGLKRLQALPEIPRQRWMGFLNAIMGENLGAANGAHLDLDRMKGHIQFGLVMPTRLRGRR